MDEGYDKTDAFKEIMSKVENMIKACHAFHPIRRPVHCVPQVTARIS